MKFEIKSIKRSFRHLVDSARYSVAGLLACFKDEQAFRQEVAFGILHFILMIAINLSALQRIYLIVLYVLILVAELLNTAIESAVDLYSQEFHPNAKKAKDCASAAVFCLVVLLVVSWITIIMYYMEA